MATALGKRKREATNATAKTKSASAESLGGLNEDVQAVFRRHFEAQFKPLPTIKKAMKVVEYAPGSEDGDETDWDGISDPDDTGPIEVIEHPAAQPRPVMTKEELKAFMSSTPPTESFKPLALSKSKITPSEDDFTEAANLKNDLALQRLLVESHLLESSSSPTLSGNNRHKATDLRLQTLGAKKSILRQEKMPMSHRRGIIAKQAEREDRRRREARENGIILEKIKGGTKRRNEGKRERGIGGPGVGKFSGGTLTLSKKDIIDIEGPRKKSDGKSGRGRGAKGSGGKWGNLR